jgi:hypothetical protein
MRIASFLAVTVGLLPLTWVVSASAGNAPGARLRPDVSVQATAGPLTVTSVSYNPQTQDNSITASISLTGTTDDGGGNDVVCGIVFDDGAIVAFQCVDIPVGSTVPTIFTLQWTGPIGKEAPGVGLYVIDDTTASDPGEGETLVSIDPLFLAPIPTLSEWALMGMVGLLVVVGLWTMRRRFSTSSLG